MFSLDNREKHLLLTVARQALIAAVETGMSPESFPSSTNTLECAGVFVTLRRRGRLRGCIGQLGSKEPAVEIVAYAARSAALHDPRFAAVERHELAEIEIELSILSPPAEIAPEAIEVGKHGLIVSLEGRRGLLLPQVAAEYSWQALRFLEETCVKAGLERNAWKNPQTQILGFTAHVFSESEILSESEMAKLGPAKSGYSSST